MTKLATITCLVLALALAPCAALAQLDLDLEGEGEVSADLEADTETDAEGEVEGSAEEAPAQAAEEAEAEAADPVEDEQEPPSEPEQAVDEETPAGAAEAAPSRAISLYMAAGLGVGSLSFTKPTAAGVQYLPESRFAAAEVLMRLHVWPAEALSLEAQVAYQTSLGFALELRPLFALPERLAVRALRVELSFGPHFAFSDSKRGLALVAPVGFVVRSFFPEVHQYRVDPHNLGSVFLRPELIVPLGELITLRAGPEAHWILLNEPSLEREGATGSGYALGIQGSVQAAVGDTFSVALAYRELHSLIPAAGRFEDTERFLTVRFGGAL